MYTLKPDGSRPLCQVEISFWSYQWVPRPIEYSIKSDLFTRKFTKALCTQIAIAVVNFLEQIYDCYKFTSLPCFRGVLETICRRNTLVFGLFVFCCYILLFCGDGQDALFLNIVRLVGIR